MATDDPNSNDDTTLEPLDRGVALALTTRFGRTRRHSGAEPEHLEEIALYVDGALPQDRRTAVEARLAREPELRAMVDELAKLEAAPSNVIPLVIPAGRTSRVGQAGLAGGLRSLPMPEPKKKNPLRTAVIGIGAALALAAVLFLAVQPPVKTDGTQGAGIGGKPDGIAIGFDNGQAVLEVDAAMAGELSVLLATPTGTHAVGLCDAKACLVTQDRLPLRVGKNPARAVLGNAAASGTCAFVLALTANGLNPGSERSAAYIDPHATAAALGTVVTKDCVLESLDRLKTVSGARHVAFMKVP